MVRLEAVVVALKNKLEKLRNKSPEEIRLEEKRGERMRKQVEKLNIAKNPVDQENRRNKNGRIMMWECLKY